MARKITIPLTDHDANCSTSYTVSYKLDGDTLWTSQPYFIPPFEINNLMVDSLYNIKITRHCCDGVQSTPLELSVNTSILAAPAGFTATPGDTEVALDWDDVTSATSYTLERADDTAFTVNESVIYTGAASNYTDTGLTNDQTYYYRVKATALYHADSEYSTDNATPTA
ncbi:MAG: hypothetical protein H6550_13820 [Chitinophagales bacterium]|nr:hypothetical protein [Chitinophagales bacterium]